MLIQESSVYKLGRLVLSFNKKKKKKKTWQIASLLGFFFYSTKGNPGLFDLRIIPFQAGSMKVKSLPIIKFYLKIWLKLYFF
jgi:hypothetical protein